MSDKRKQLDKAINKLKEKNPSLNLGFNNIIEPEYIRTPFVTLNSLNNGGIPKGKFGTIAGPSQTAKSTLLAQIIGYNMQQNPDFHALWTDAENSVDKKWFEKLGVDLNRLIVQDYDEQAHYMEALLDDALALVDTRAIDMWVIDSIGALEPKADSKKELKDEKMLNLQRKLGEFFRRALRVIAAKESYAGCACILIGQVYNVPTTTGVGLEEVRGGNSVKHFAHWRWKTRRGSKDEGPAAINVRFPDGKVGKIVPGWPQRIKLDKTKINEKESQEIILQFIHGRGLDSTNAAITALIANEIVKRDGAMYSHSLFEKPIRGRDNLIKILQDNSELRDKLVKEMDQLLAQSHIEEIKETEDSEIEELENEHQDN